MPISSQKEHHLAHMVLTLFWGDQTYTQQRRQRKTRETHAICATRAVGTWLIRTHSRARAGWGQVRVVQRHEGSVVQVWNQRRRVKVTLLPHTVRPVNLKLRDLGRACALCFVWC